MANISNKKLKNGYYKLYFVQICDINGGTVVYKFGITGYEDIMYRFSNVLDKYSIKVLCTWTFTSKEKAEAFENVFLSLYKKWPNGKILESFTEFRGKSELRDLNNTEKTEILNFMFNVKNNCKNKLVL